MIRMETLEKSVERLETGVRDALRQDDHEALVRALDGFHPADIAEVMERVDDEETIRIFRALDTARAAEALDELEPERARYLLDHEVPERIASLLDVLPMDDVAEVLAEAATPERQESLLSQLADRAPGDAQEVRELLAFKPGTAGRLMTEKFVRLGPDLTVEEAFAAIRRADPEVETLSDLYVTEGQRLLGVLSLRQLVRAAPEQQIADVMVRDIISVGVDTDQEEVARLIARYDFLAIPVLYGDGRIAGIVTVDDIVDVLTQEQTEDAFKQGAIAAGADVLNAAYFSVPIWRVVRSRVGWLVLLFVGGTLTGEILKHFEDELARVVALSVFIPLLIGTGGNTGAQSVSTIIRAIALGEVRGQDALRVLGRELLGGLLLGLLLGAIALVWTLARGNAPLLCVVVALTIVAICTWANIIGSLIPLLAQKCKIDPALVSAPLITTLVDATGLLIYLSVARFILPELRL